LTELGFLNRFNERRIFMLTNLFYYDFYKPFIFKNEKLTSKYPAAYKKSERSVDPKSRSDKFDDSENEYSFFLNKAFKNEIVDYAETISIDLNSIKNSVRNIINNTENLYMGFDSKKESLRDELREFVRKYNSYKDFAEKNYRQSPLLSDFSDSLRFRVENCNEVLSDFGIHFDDDKNDLLFDEDYYDSLYSQNVSDSISKIREFCEDIYNDACEIMTVPMEEHMNFKSLDFYYNYIFSNGNHNTVKIIETGMLVDISL